MLGNAPHDWTHSILQGVRQLPVLHVDVCVQALVLLTEVRGMLVSLLLPHHGKLKEKIEEVLDVELIKQQIDTGVLEFEKYAGYIIGRTLCPSRLFLFDYRYRHGTGTY